MTVRELRNKTSILFLSLISMLLVSGAAFAQAIPQKNVNVIGPTPPNTWYVGDTFMQFNESDGACSPNNPRWCAIGMNDYRGVNNPLLGDAFPGIAMTRGENWISGLHPDNLIDTQNINQKFGADPNLEAVPGMLFYNFIAGWRDGSQPGGVYLSRWYEHNREVGPPWQFKDTLAVETGTSGRFLDKPTFKIAYLEPGSSDISIVIPPLVDPADNISLLHDEFTLTIPAMRMHLCYAVFVGNDNNDGTKINCLYSDDAGGTWTSAKLSESVDINQGISLATRNYGQDVLACWLRFRDNNEDDALMCAFSSNGANTWSKPELITNFCPFNQGTGPARHRTNALPVVVSNEKEFAVYFASRNTPTGTNDTCILPGKGKKDPTIQMSNVAYADDFDSFGEDPNVSPRERDGLVRTSRNFSRIMMMRSSDPGSPGSWGPVTAVDPQLRDDVAECNQGGSQNTACRKNGHQYMPAAFAAGGIETVAWYDSRMDRLNRLSNPITSGYVDDVVVNLKSGDADGDGIPDVDANGDPTPPWASATLLPAGVYDLEPPPSNLPPPGHNIPLRRNIDVFAAQIVDGFPRQYTVDPDTFYPSVGASNLLPSVRVTQFATRVKRDASGSPIFKQVNGVSVPQREQVEFNFPNARLFRKGTRPFIGDYNTVFAVNARMENGNWVSNQSAITAQNVDATLFSSLEPAFHIGWTSNRDVRGKVFYTGCDRWDETLQMWLSDKCVNSEYATPGLPPTPTGAMLPLQGESGDSLGNPPGACRLSDTIMSLPRSSKGPLTRNQKIYTSKLKPGINVEVLSAVKDRSDTSGAGVPINTFVIGVQNGSPGVRRVRIELPADETFVGFDRRTFIPDAGEPTAPPKLFIDVVIPAGSSNIRTVFDIAGDLADDVIVTAWDVTNVDRTDPDTGELMDSEPGTGNLVARVSLDRNSVLPLEPLVAFDPDNLPIDITEQDFFRLLLSRETTAEKILDFENLEFENLEFENLDFENRVKLLDFENSAELLEFENLEFENTVVFLDFENLDFENIFITNANLGSDSYSLLDFENLEFENNSVELLDFENLEFENRTLYSDLESLDFENTFLEALDFENTAGEFLDFENLDFENLEFENLEFENLEFENLEFENLEFENSAFPSSAVDNPDLRNLTLDAALITKPSVEVSWKAESDGNTTSGVDLKPIFSQALVNELNESNTQVILSVRKIYYTPTVSLTADTGSFCTVQIIAKNQVVYSAILSPEQVNTFFNDPNADEAVTPGFQIDPNGENIITLQLINPPAKFDTAVELAAGAGMAMFAQGASTQCIEDLEAESEQFDSCEIDAPLNDTTPPSIVAPADIIVEATATLTPIDAMTLGVATATDEVGVESITSNAPLTYPVGETTVTWTATDTSGNFATADQLVTVTDSTAPSVNIDPDSFMPPSPYVLPVGSPANATFPVSWQLDAQDPTDLTFSCTVSGETTPLVPLEEDPIIDTVTGTLTHNYSYPFPAGPSSVSCTITDLGGNETTATFNVLVEDVPTIDALESTLSVTTAADGGTTVTVFEADMIANIVATDLVDEDADLLIACLSTGSQEFEVGQHTITCTVTDSYGEHMPVPSTTFTLDVAYRYELFFNLPKGRLEAGSTLPVDFYYEFNGTRIDASAIAPTASWYGPDNVSGCAADPLVPPGSLSGEDSGSSSFRWSAAKKIWQFSWQTPGEPGQYLFTISPPGTSSSTAKPICLK